MHLFDTFRSLVGALPLACLLLSCSGNTSPNTVTAEVGSGGGTITVDAGPLAGTALTIPAAAVPDGTKITIDQSSTPLLLGYETLGPGANFVAEAAQLAIPASARLVFDPALLPAGATGSDLVVIRQTSQGRRVTVPPTALDLTVGTVEVSVDRFASYWVARRTLDIDFVLANYFPLFDGDTFVFDNGVVLSLQDELEEPNLEGIFVTKATFDDGLGGDYGLYLRREFTETFLFGEFSASAGFQTVGIPPLLWLPETGRLDMPFFDRHGVTVYRPYGSTVPTDVAEVRTATTIASQGRLDTPLGRFTNVLELVFVIERTDSRGLIETTTDRLWLARGIGPVQIELSGIGTPARGRLVSGVVGGSPIIPD